MFLLSCVALCINDHGKSDGKLSDGSEQTVQLQYGVQEEGVTPCDTVENIFLALFLGFVSLLDSLVDRCNSLNEVFFWSIFSFLMF